MRDPRCEDDRSIDLDAWPTAPDDPPGKAETARLLAEEVRELVELQRRLIAQDRWAVLVILQGMDASGKDGLTRAVFSGIDPAGCHVSAFKAPSAEELDHDFLWRTVKALPERGRIGVFNRSWYEEVTAVRVQPEWLDRQKLPEISADVWDERLASIRHLERHLRRNGTLVLKFFLHISKGEQKRRLLQRIDDPKRNWKFQASDVDARTQWKAYRAAWEDAIRETARPEAPWFVIPADDKPAARLQVARILRAELDRLDLAWPTPDKTERAVLAAMRERLEEE